MTEPGTRAQSRVDLLNREFDLTTLVAVRRHVEECSEKNGLTGLALYRFVVAVNEITTNAVRHGGGAGRLELWRVGDRLFCRVSDDGPGMPPGRVDDNGPPSPYAVGGRGLWLARQGTADVTVRSDGGGTTVTLAGPSAA